MSYLVRVKVLLLVTDRDMLSVSEMELLGPFFQQVKVIHY